ncbi:MAG: peptidoglycan glycosyltransferase [Cytophagales bacterium]|nr:peptidoglycan glycosyltransferase [Cytophagales bacterium]
MNERTRISIVIILLVLVSSIFLTRLFFLQVKSTEYKIKATKVTTIKKDVYPYRGIIYDRYGKLLVYNTTVYDLQMVLKKAKIPDTARFCELLGIDKEHLLKETAKAKKLFRYRVPHPLIKQMSKERYAKVQDIFDYEGFEFVPKLVREYPHGSLANTLGYIAEINAREKAKSDTTERYYKRGDYIGKKGLERTYERELRGIRGVNYILRDVHGIEKGRFADGRADTLAVAGYNLQSTINLSLQQYGEQLMVNKIGSIVALEPSTGEILSIVTSPSYNPNLLAGENFSKNYNVLQKDSLKPLYDRATRASYPPGSIFKLVQALIGMQEGVLKPNTYFTCDRSLVGCHGHPSPLNLHQSIQHSCNPYYYKAFKKILNQKLDAKNQFIDTRLGYEKWRKHVLSFGLGQKLGSDISHEKGGAVRKTSFYNKWYGENRWKVSTIYSNAIGQGELLVVPIQMANLAAIIANKGHYYIPHTIKSIGDSTVKLKRFMEKQYTTVDSSHFQLVHDAMEDVIKAGTARRAYHKDIRICGKTGTAQNPHGEDHSVFIAFAPKDDPKIAIAVYVENAGYGGTWAAPIASLMIEKHLNDSISRPYLEKYILEGDLIKK